MPKAAQPAGDSQPAVQRWAAGVEYLGTEFAGWQRLDSHRTVQGEIERALSAVADQPIQTITAGRTDARVHALQQVIHFDCIARRTPYAWLLGTNSNLPPDINLRWIQPVPDTFHARFGAIERRYRYVIHNHRARSSLLRERTAWWPQPLDDQAMHRAAQSLIGVHDFSAFRDSQCQAPSPVRELKSLQVFRRGDMVVLDVCGNAFLHHMVRNIAGTLTEVGLGDRPESWVGEVLAGRDRREAGMTAPAGGLYFVGPRYPAEFSLPDPPHPWFPA